MNCEKSQEYMMKFFDEEINDIEEVQFRQHIKNCKRCSEEFACMDEIIGSLETADPIEPPEDFEARIMEKVNTIELKRKEKNNSMIVLLYNAATLVSIILLMVFVADLKQGGILSAFDTIRGYFGSFSSIATAVMGVLGDLFHLLTGVVGVLFEVFISIFKTYYYVFVALLALLLALQRLLAIVAAQDGRKS